MSQSQEAQKSTDLVSNMSKEEFFRKVDEGRRQINEGKFTSVKTKEELDAFLDSL